MKNFITLTLLAFLLSISLNAQDSMFTVKDNVVNLGVGIGSIYGSGINSNTTIPPVSISFERAIKDEVLGKGVIGVGAYLGYTSYKWQYTYSSIEYGWKYSNIVVGARGTFHYPLLDKLDSYLGIMLGYNIISASSFGTNGGTYAYTPDAGSIAFSGFAGGRYYFSDSFFGFMELGYGISYLNLGIGIKL
ncbi:MAG: hypothetical protein RQ743_12340 [Bacteroidales bacterium]|nr:hypothetical protein [Bacteroidales bacterium]